MCGKFKDTARKIDNFKFVNCQVSFGNRAFKSKEGLAKLGDSARVYPQSDESAHKGPFNIYVKQKFDLF